MQDFCQAAGPRRSEMFVCDGLAVNKLQSALSSCCCVNIVFSIVQCVSENYSYNTGGGEGGLAVPSA